LLGLGLLVLEGLTDSPSGEVLLILDGGTSGSRPLLCGLEEEEEFEEDLVSEDVLPLNSPPLMKALLLVPPCLGLAWNSFDSQSNSSAESDSTEERRGILDGDGGMVGTLLGVAGILDGEVGNLEMGSLLPEPADLVE